MSDLKCWVTSNSSTGRGKFHSGDIRMSYPLEREGYLTVMPPSIRTEVVGGRLLWQLNVGREEMILLYQAIRKALLDEKDIQGKAISTTIYPEGR